MRLFWKSVIDVDESGVDLGDKVMGRLVGCEVAWRWCFSTQVSW